jgi:putative aldouronate transport system permease protein
VKIRGKPDRIWDMLIYTFLILIGVITIYPFLNIIAISFNDAGDTIKGGIGILPRKFTLLNYQKVFSYPTLITGFANSVLRTVIGTALSVFCTACMAFTLSRKDFMARKFFNTLFMITMYVSGGMVPGYLLIRNLHLFNNFLVYILPGLVGAFFVFIMRAYVEELPLSLQESAMIDGANDAVIFFKIVIPLSLPSIATVALFYAVGQWNSWFDTYLFCSMNENLTTLQYELQKILNSVTAAAAAAQKGSVQALIESMKSGQITPKSIQMAISVVVVVPIILVYPFLQKYFISGMTIGAVKG